MSVALPSDPPTTIFGTPQPFFVTTAADNRAFVSIVPCVPSSVREINLTNLTVQARPDAGSACGTYVPYPEMGASSDDGSSIVFASNSGLEPPGPKYTWRYDAISDTFSGPIIFEDLRWTGIQATVDGDGGVMAVGQGTLDQRLLPLVPLSQGGGGDLHLQETGSLLYNANNAVLISETRNGRDLLMIGLPAGVFGGPYRQLAIHPSGGKILVATQSGNLVLRVGSDSACGGYRFAISGVRRRKYYRPR